MPVTAAIQPYAPSEPIEPVAPSIAAEPQLPPAATQVQGNQVQQLFAAIQVERTPEGGLKIEAPPEAAGALAAMFQGMADLLAGVTGPSSSE